ncbi:MAG TPA: hypothetical protein VL201_02530 [Patescibacteria group bacterium]|jgi:hypothetical protein|nr:hypothetical protein [Patescibacteria group bacterium]
MLYYNQRRSLLLLLSVISVTFTSERAPISLLELFPGKGFENVSLGHPYHHMTDEEKANSVYLQEGCYTILDNTQEGACALVGPLQPCQLFYLSINDKTIIAHVSLESSFSLLLTTIKDQFAQYDISKISGELFTNKTILYNSLILKDFTTKKMVSFCERSQGRTQIQELKYNKDLIINTFGIQDRTQILAHQFTSSKKDFELGKYEAAELFVFIKIRNNEAAIFNTCPLAEKYFGNFDHISDLVKRHQTFEQARKNIQNPFFVSVQQKLSTISYSSLYGSFPFVYIPSKKN